MVWRMMPPRFETQIGAEHPERRPSNSTHGRNSSNGSVGGWVCEAHCCETPGAVTQDPDNREPALVADCGLVDMDQVGREGTPAMDRFDPVDAQVRRA
ncbi:MAG: hypothetical protein L0H37_08075 [Nitrosospira sp.]|nr:hypothetical protein [Nitrosospira sp.]